MFKEIDELKEFIVWAKENGLSSVKVGDIHVEISHIGILQSASEVQTPIEQAVAKTNKPMSPEEKKSRDDKAQEEEDDLLFWSSNN